MNALPSPVKWLGRVALGLGIVAIIAAVVVSRIVGNIDAQMNPVAPHEPWPVSAEARALHDTLMVADLHADTLLWGRDPAKRHERGQTDLPRFREGGMFLQVFGAVTKSPEGQNYEENSAAAGDRITLLAMAQGWPPATWGSLEARAAYQAQRLQRLAKKDDAFFLVRTKSDLGTALAARAENPEAMAGILATEGSHALEGDLDAIDRLYAEGYRVMGFHHFFDNALGGSLHGQSGEGLSDFGRAALAAMEEKGIIFDVAHSSEAVVRDVLALTDRPVILSHTGIDSACPSPRNVSDELMSRIAERGGLIGIGFWADAICDDTPAGIARMIAHAVSRFGEDHIALGSDFDGSVPTTIDASELAAITHALLQVGLSPTQIEKVMGGNQIRFFMSQLPEA